MNTRIVPQAGGGWIGYIYQDGNPLWVYRTRFYWSKSETEFRVNHVVALWS